MKSFLVVAGYVTGVLMLGVGIFISLKLTLETMGALKLSYFEFFAFPSNPGLLIWQHNPGLAALGLIAAVIGAVIVNLSMRTSWKR